MKFFISGALSAIFLFLSFTIQAQSGWHWVTHVSASSHLDPAPICIDSSRNLYSLCENDNSKSVTFGSTTINNPRAFEQLIISKMDSTGKFLWAIGTQLSEAHGKRIREDGQGNIYFVGYYTADSLLIDTQLLINKSGTYMGFLAKISSAGKIIWANNLASSFFLDLDIDPTGKPLVASTFIAPSTTIGAFTLYNNDPSGKTQDIYVAKFDNAGNALWAIDYGGTEGETVAQIVAYKNGDCFVTGTCFSPAIKVGWFTLKNPGYKTFGCNFLARLDSLGRTRVAKKLSGHVGIAQLAVDDSENVYMVGDVDSTLITGKDTTKLFGQHDILIAKYDYMGDAIWTRTAGGKINDMASSIAIDACGHMWVSGVMGEAWGGPAYSMNFDGHILNTPAKMYDPMFIAEYDIAGNYLNSIAMGSGGDDESGIVVDNKGNFYSCGDSWKTDVAFGKDTIPSNIEEVFFIAKYQYSKIPCIPSSYINIDTSKVITDPVDTGSTVITDTTIIMNNPLNHNGGSSSVDSVKHYGVLQSNQAMVEQLPIVLAPNPASSKCVIQYADPFPIGSRAELLDMSGRIVETYRINGKDPVISLTNLSSGVYECRVIAENIGIVIKKLTIVR